jgi:hypothetical protein
MEKQAGQCPFLKQQCIKERCELWGGLNIATPAPIVGALKTNHLSGCVFNLALFALINPRPIVIGPPRPLGSLS